MKKSLSILKKTLLIVSAALLVQGVQANDKLVALTLQQAQEYALTHNRTIENASIDVRKAEAARWQSIAAMLPQVNAQTDYSNYFGYVIDLGQMKLAMPPYSSIGVTTSMTLNGAMIVSAEVSKISKKMSDITLKKTEKQICDNVKTIYCSALVAQASIDLIDESLNSMEKLYAMTLKSVEVGIAEQTSADQLKVQVLNLRNSKSSAKRSLEVVFNTMRLLLNLDVDADIRLMDSIEGILNLESVNRMLDGSFDINDNFDYKLLMKSTELAKKQIALTGWSNGPTLSIYHQYTMKKYFSDEKTMNMTPPNVFGATLKIPIFTSLKATYAVKSAKYAYRQQENILADTEKSLKLQYNQLKYNLRTAVENYEAQSENVDVAQKVFDNIAQKYAIGVSSSLDVTNANTSLITAKSSLIQSVMDILTAQISLEELTNR